MILYNVTVSIDESVHDDWLMWMKSTHVPEVMATGLFIDSKICKIHAEEEGGKSYSIQYIAPSWEAYRTYESKFAPELQKAHVERYNGKFGAFRTLLEIVHHQVKQDGKA